MLFLGSKPRFIRLLTVTLVTILTELFRFLLLWSIKSVLLPYIQTVSVWMAKPVRHVIISSCEGSAITQGCECQEETWFPVRVGKRKCIVSSNGEEAYASKETWRHLEKVQIPPNQNFLKRRIHYCIAVKIQRSLSNVRTEYHVDAFVATSWNKTM
jgi:hypothetical protein